MFHLSVVCPQHHLPFEHVVLNANDSLFLRCKNCPFHPASCRISTELQHLNARMGSTKSRQRSKSKGKNHLKGKQRPIQSQEETVVIQMIAEEQVRTIELVMKLLTEDKRNCFGGLEKKVAGHKKLWHQFTETTNDHLFLSKMCNNSLLLLYTKLITEQGWKVLDKVLRSVNDRTYICKQIIKQSKEIAEELKKQGKTNEPAILRNLQNLIRKPQGSVVQSVHLSKSSLNSSSTRSKSIGSS